ncbi:ATPase [Beijerinckia indica]|uniref:E1-E2 ATPase-associated domain protein n=1 Tax=Beijerinckia indica subsp. indica (strain ATCC 9039 / DSM 1715 / NCIMB 8712) TaxID=395963 RepID=B2ICQ2_BEII9|nr:ATPase [Beijerinckia indica]ACB95326.1 E1-E2 ATPase-associated domain protein [Beijerinckia indica subsp. indica ATCC 9039]
MAIHKTFPRETRKTGSSRGTISTGEPWLLGASAAGSQPVIKISPGHLGVSIWSHSLFANSNDSVLREFLARAFSVAEITEAEIRKQDAFGRLHYRASADAATLLRKLGRALRGGDADSASLASSADRVNPAPFDVDALYLPVAGVAPLRIFRVGSSLSSWRVRQLSDGEVRLVHPVLFNRKDIAYRLEEELAVILGIETFSASILTASVSIRFDPDRLELERLVRELEKSWPRLLHGLEAPPSRKRLAVAGGLLALSYTGQYFVPAVKPFAILGVALYSAPNLMRALQQLTHFHIGVPALRAMGLTLMLISARPFATTVAATLLQLWRHISYATAKRAQRRLFAAHRRRSIVARLLREDGLEIKIDTDALAPGDFILVREGEMMPVDGVVVSGFAAVDEESLSGSIDVIDKAPGDRVFATSFIRAGYLTLRVETIGEDTAAGSIGAQLPHAQIGRLPSSDEVERIADRNAKPALALAAINLAVTGVIHRSQGIMRPDYVTAPLMTTQLTTLHNLANGLSQGIFVRNPSVLDQFASADTYVFDDACDLERRTIEVSAIIAADGFSEDTVLGYAAAACSGLHNERTTALVTECSRRGTLIPAISNGSRHAGVVRYLDDHSHLIEIAAPAYIASAETRIPQDVTDRLQAFAGVSDHRDFGDVSRISTSADPSLRPLWVLRDGVVLGVLIFRRQGKLEATDVIAALKKRSRKAQFIHMSSRPQAEAEAKADTIGISKVFGDLDQAGKVRVLEDLGGHSVWIGNGASPRSISLIKASTISISVGGLASVASDAADVTLLQPGLAGLVPLKAIESAHRTRIEADYRVVYTANFIGTMGAIAADFGGLKSGLISNAAVAMIFLSHWKRLQDLIAQSEARSAMLLSSFHKEDDLPVA